MTQEDKQLLLTDLCARLPYGVHLFTNSKHHIRLLTISNDIDYNEQYWVNGLYDIDEVKPYLRPMSSITEEEKEKLRTLFDAEEVTTDSICYLEGGTLVEYLSRIQYSFCSKIIDWLNVHHFDYRELIEKGLALEAPKDMYNF